MNTLEHIDSIKENSERERYDMFYRCVKPPNVIIYIAR